MLKQPGRAVLSASSKQPTSNRDAIQLAITAAATRATEGEKLYAGLAELLDSHAERDDIKNLPTHMRNALKALNDDLSTVARRHYEAYIRGSERPPAPYTMPANALLSPPSTNSGWSSATTPAPSSPAPGNPPKEASSRAESTSGTNSRPSSYAQAAAQTPPSAYTSQAAPRPKAVTPPPVDHRLFVRLPQTHSARKLPGYTILDTLRQRTDIGQHLQDVQATKTGFALRPTQPNALDSHIPALAKYFQGCTIDKAVAYTSYRLSCVPRYVTLLDGLGQPSKVSVTPAMLNKAITEATGTTPALINQTKASEETPHDYSSNWIVRVPSDAKQLPRSLLLFGMRATARPLPNRTNIPQCSRCLHWHNERSCARAARCRICGSTEHAEDLHPKCHGDPHQCVARCIHCHGPHPADSLECLLRPQPNKKPLSKAQKAQIRQSSAAARLRLLAQCQATGPETMELSGPETMELPGTQTPRPSTPTTQSSTALEPPITRSRTRLTTPSLVDPPSPTPNL